MFIYKEEKQNKAQKYIHKKCPPWSLHRQRDKDGFQRSVSIFRIIQSWVYQFIRNAKFKTTVTSYFLIVKCLNLQANTQFRRNLHFVCMDWHLIEQILHVLKIILLLKRCYKSVHCVNEYFTTVDSNIHVKSTLKFGTCMKTQPPCNLFLVQK